MEQEQEILQWKNELRPERSTTLKVFVILSAIGNTFAVFGGLRQVFGAQPREQLNQMVQQLDEKGDKMPAFARDMMQNAIDMMSANLETMERWNRPIGMVALVGAILCFTGLYYLWNLKKNGLYLWLTGEFLPIVFTVATFGFIGFKMGTFGAIMTALNFILPFVFGLVFYNQSKRMK